LPATRYEARAIRDLDGDVVGHHLAWLLGASAIAPQANVAREHGGRGARARLEQAALGQDGVEPLA
jgi:isocitrate dehydrogenase